MIRKEIIGYYPSITSVREVRDGDSQRLKEPLWGRQGWHRGPSNLGVTNIGLIWFGLVLRDDGHGMSSCAKAVYFKRKVKNVKHVLKMKVGQSITMVKSMRLHIIACIYIARMHHECLSYALYVCLVMMLSLKATRFEA